MDTQFREAIKEPGSDAGRYGLSYKSAVLVHSCRVVEKEGVLKRNDVSLHALHFGHMGNTAGSVSQSGNLHQ